MSTTVKTMGALDLRAPNGTRWYRTNVLGTQHDVAYGNGIWVTDRCYSLNGIDWVANPIQPTLRYGDARIYYADGLWVAGLCAFSGKSALCYSEDGINWAQSHSFDGFDGTVDFDGIVHRKGIWILSASKLGTYPSSHIYYSTDGKTWTESNGTSWCMRIGYGNGMFSTGTQYSTDGRIWSSSTGLPSASQVIYANGLWVSAGLYGLYHSTDGKTWTQGKTGMFEGLCYGNMLWIAGGRSSADKPSQGLWYSEDGKAWTQSNITENLFSAISYANGVYIAICNYNEGTGGIYCSTDGKVWNVVENVTVGDVGLQAAAIANPICANGLWVAATYQGIYYSPVWEPPTTI